MIVTRQPDSEHSHWSSKYGTIYPTPRMSNFASPLTTQPGWQGHYSFLPPGETNIFAQSLEQAPPTNSSSNAAAGQRSASADHARGAEQSKTSPVVPAMSHSRSMDPLGLRAPKVESPTQEQSESRVEAYGVKSESVLEGPLPSIVASPPLESDAMDNRNGNDDLTLGKDEDDDVLDDEDDMMDGDDGASHPQTAAERTAARRKMKRFRLTHQQTRFLMSEFAKQPHPDAAHRERLSREIPGLSPRQVQVWFQNRRAKIKRLTADDRDRMIKMRAVPDDFDNVQALHSPYGAVHALGTPITPPVDFGNPAAYADHMMRPMMIDSMRRGDGDEHMGPAGISPGFGGLGFASSGGMGSQDMLSPLSSPAGTERGYYSSHLASPMSNGPRSSNPFARHGTMDAGMQQQMHAQSRQQQQVRPLQPLQLRETVSRARSESLQSPLRSSMSWKGDNIDFGYQAGSPSPVMGGRNPSLYQSDQMATSPVGYDSSSYSGSTGMHSPPNQLGYSSLHGTTLQPPPQNRSRLRAASATLPLGLDLRTQYRSVSSGQAPPTSGSALTPRSASTAPYGSSVAYTSSYPSAPLTAPVEYSFPRTPGVSSAHEYSIPSAPIAPSQDFSQALHGASMTSPTSRTPMRDSFGRHGDRRDEYSQDIYGELKRKRSFGMSQTGHATAPTSQPYGHSS